MNNNSEEYRKLYNYTQRARVVKRGTVDGYEYIIASCKGHPNAYIVLPGWHPFYQIDTGPYNLYNEINWCFNVHGGLSYSGDLEPEIPEFVIGWDYAHARDCIDYGYAKSNGHVWTIDEIMEDVKSAVSTLKEHENDEIDDDANESVSSKNKKNMKRFQRINESQLNTIVTEAVKMVLNEMYYDDVNEGRLSRVAGTAALGASLLLGGNRTAIAANNQSTADINGTEYAQETKTGVVVDEKRLPESLRKSILKLAEKKSKEYGTTIYIGVGEGKSGMSSSIKSENNALQQYMLSKKMTTIEGMMPIKQIDGGSQEKTSSGTVLTIGFYIESSGGYN